MPTPTESEIRSRLQAFADEIVAVVRASAVDAVSEALQGIESSLRGGSPRGGRRRAGASVRTKGAKRDPRVLEALSEKLGAFIKANPGKRIEEIGKALGTPTRELALPVKKLIAAKKLSTKGQKRATTYFAV